MKEFDIVLVYSFGRENLFFLSIIKYLSANYKIAFVVHDSEDFIERPHNTTFKKIAVTEKKFRKLCVEYGARKVYSNQKIKCKIMLMYPFDYEKDYLDNIRNNIAYKSLVGLLFHARGFRNLCLLKEMGATKYFAPGKFLIKMIAKYEGIDDQLEGLELVECGYPYVKYPVFEDNNFDIDYLIALPSIVHLKRESGYKRWLFFKNLTNNLSLVSKNDRVYIKHHNVKDVQRYYGNLFGSVGLLRLSAKTLDLLALMCPLKKLKDRIYYFASAYWANLIERKYSSLDSLTEFHNFGLELFLPFVKKGLFTGLSGSVFHCLYNRSAVYNCDSQEIKEGFPPFYHHFKINCSSGDLSFDEQLFQLIPEEVRQADIIKLIKQEVDVASL